MYSLQGSSKKSFPEEFGQKSIATKDLPKNVLQEGLNMLLRQFQCEIKTNRETNPHLSYLQADELIKLTSNPFARPADSIFSVDSPPHYNG